MELTEDGLRRGGRTTPMSELNLAAMAEAFQRGCWLGGGGVERPLERLAKVVRHPGTRAKDFLGRALRWGASGRESREALWSTGPERLAGL
ncbi:hypothetical protein [Streptomyces sp. NPDC049915]|uniref:hypothetical protein n=1 Tax=Streptomyces sp. NPDC049915 TaxID=3155510 RepID=UPI00342CEF66